MSKPVSASCYERREVWNSCTSKCCRYLKGKAEPRQCIENASILSLFLKDDDDIDEALADPRNTKKPKSGSCSDFVK